MSSLDLFDRPLAEEYGLICGVDEAGRGPLAGPVCVAAVILDPQKPLEGINDSKKLTEKKREALYPQIIESAIAYKIVMVGPETIDRINILQATMLGMRQAVEGLSPAPHLALIDGNRCRRGSVSRRGRLSRGTRPPRVSRQPRSSPRSRGTGI